MAFSASFYWDYNTQLAGLLGSTWPKHFSKSTCSVQINKTIMLWSVPGACHWAHSAASWEILASSEAPHQAQLPVLGMIHNTKYSGHHCHSFCCCLIYVSCRFPWNPNDWFLIGRDHVVWCMPQRIHMPCVYFSRVVDFALGVLTWAMSHIYNQGA
jgi:hypothetical protein